MQETIFSNDLDTGSFVQPGELTELRTATLPGERPRSDRMSLAKSFGA